MRAQDTVVVIPSLNPDDKLQGTVDGILGKGFSHVIVVDDGSDAEHKEPFEYAESHGCTVLTHEVNRGKGCAMKTAFSYIEEHHEYDECPGAITVDGDGQHRPDDIYACCEAMLAGGCERVVLGVRAFDGNVPWKSRCGNAITSFAFLVLCGIRLHDTQTGLRAIPHRFLNRMCEYRGERYEYETNQLLEMKNDGIGFDEVTIETVYIDDNASSHFHPFRDSFRIYRIIFSYAISSIASSLIDLGAFYLFLKLLKGCMGGQTLDTAGITMLAGVLARVVSSLCNYSMNRKVVFKSAVKGSFLRYYALAAVQMLLSSGIVASLSSLFAAADVLKTVIKALVDGILFFASFQIQRTWVFSKKKDKNL